MTYQDCPFAGAPPRTLVLARLPSLGGATKGLVQVILLAMYRLVDEEIHGYEGESRRRNPTIELDTMKRRGRPYIYSAVPGYGSEMFESNLNRFAASASKRCSRASKSASRASRSRSVCGLNSQIFLINGTDSFNKSRMNNTCLGGCRR